MTVRSHPPGRVGAQHRAKLRKWSDKTAQQDDARAVVDSRERRRQTLDAAKKKLRKLFH